MGRGRQKAKQTKVARALKYYSPETDYDALQRELGHANDADDSGQQSGDVEDDDSYDSWPASQER